MIADEFGHDEELGIFVARGNVEILSDGKIVKADVVTYNERTKRITAAGNVVILEPDGDTQFATYADVTDDVEEGTLQNFRMLMKDNARLAANRADRIEQNTKEILHKGVYTPCAPCATDPTRAPLWQVKAYKAVRDKVAKTVTYRDAWMEMFGVPVLYTPWFRHPDFGVDRQTGFLSPSAHFSSEIRPADQHALLRHVGAGQGRHFHADLPLSAASWRKAPVPWSTWNTPARASTGGSASKAPARSRIASRNEPNGERAHELT